MRIATVILIFIFSQPLIAQHEWELKKEKDGIKAYTKKVDGSSFDKYKIKSKIKGSIKSFVAVVQDMEIYTDIFDDTDKATIMLKEGDHTIELLIKTGAPFPFKDRYSYARTNYLYDDIEKVLTMEIACLDNEELKNVDGGIKVTNCKGGWIIKQISADSLDVEHFFHVEPEGMVPAWVVNKMTIDGPIKSLNKIKKYILQEKYQNKSFDFIKP